MNQKIQKLSEQIDHLLILRKVEELLQACRDCIDQETNRDTELRDMVNEIIKDMLDFEDNWGELPNAEVVWSNMRQVLDNFDKD